MDENRAFKALKRRDEQALEWFVDHYSAYVSTIVYNIIGSTLPETDVEEVSADVFYVLWTKSKTVKSNKVKAFLGAVARNKAKDKLRKYSDAVPLEDDFIIVSDECLETEVERRFVADAVTKAVLSMKMPDKEIFVRHYYYYQPIVDIAKAMDMNASTVKTRLRRGREKLKTTLYKGGYANENENFRFDGLLPR